MGFSGATVHPRRVTYLGQMGQMGVKIGQNDTFRPISAARRPFGPLVSGQRWIWVPPVGCRRQIAISGFHGAIVQSETCPILVQNGLFSPILTVFGLLRALEGRYGPRFVLGRDILVVYGVCLLSST